MLFLGNIYLSAVVFSIIMNASFLLSAVTMLDLSMKCKLRWHSFD